MASSFDDVLSQRVGDFGRWHFAFIATVITASTIPLEYLAQIAFHRPHHFCAQPHLENISWPRSDILTLAIPFKSNPQEPPMIGQPYQPCQEFDLDALWPEIHPNMTLKDALRLREQLYPNLTTRACQSGQTFDLTTGAAQGALGVEFGITCDREYFIPLSNAAYFMGMLVGFLISGPLSDNLGRRLVCLVCPFCYAVTGLSSCLVPGIWSFMVLRFVTAVVITIICLTAIVLSSEWININQRNAFGLYRKIHFGWIGRGFLILCFYLIPSWRIAYATYFVLALPVFSGFFLWLESPRWLLSRGRIAEAHTLLIKVIHWNGKTISSEEETVLKEELTHIAALTQTRREPYIPVRDSENTSPEGGVQSAHRDSFLTNMDLLFRNSKFRKRIFLWLLIWPIIAFVYVGLSFNSVRLGENPYLVAMLTGLIVAPGNLLQYIVYRFFSRKWPVTVLFGVESIILMILFVLVLTGNRGLPVVILSTVGLLFTDALFTVAFIRTPEVFPTSVRSTSMGMCAASSRLGMIAASYVERLDELVWPPLPMLVFFLFNVMATVASAFLPSGNGEMEEWQNDDGSASLKSEEMEMKQNVSA